MNINQYISSKRFDEIRIFFRESRQSGLCFIDKGSNSILFKMDTNEVLSNSIVEKSGEINLTFQGISEEVNTAKIIGLLSTEEDSFFPNGKYSITDTGLIFLEKKEITGYLNLNIRSKLCRDEKEQNIDLSLSFIKLISEYLKGIAIPVGNGYPSVYNKWENYMYPNEFYFNPVGKYYETRLVGSISGMGNNKVRIIIESSNKLISKSQIDRIDSFRLDSYKASTIVKKFFWEQYEKWKDDCELPELKNDQHLMSIVYLTSITIPENPDEMIRLFFRTWDEEHGQFAYYKNSEEITFD